MAKRMVNDAEEVNKITEHVRQEGNKTVIGGNLEVTGDLTVNGSAPGGSSVHRYKCLCLRSDNKQYVGFFWDTQTDTTDATTLSMEIANVLRQTPATGIAGTNSSGAVYGIRAKYSGGPELSLGADNVDLTLSIVKLY